MLGANLLSTSHLANLQPVVQQALTAGRVPGLVLAVARADESPELLAVGTDASGRPLVEDDLFPVASITKLALALAVLRLIEQGLLALDAPLSSYLPTARAAEPGVTIRNLLSHSSGLPMEVPPGLAPYSAEQSWSTLAPAALATPLEAPPNTRVQYGSPDYMLLAIIIEQATGLCYAEAYRQLVFEPLGIEAYIGTEPPRPPAVIGDVRNRHEGTPLEWFNSRFWRQLGWPYGGLVTNVAGALALVRAFRPGPTSLLRPETAAEATANQTSGLGGGQYKPLIWADCPWGLGPELHGDKRPHWAPLDASPDSFGHAGASGTLAWFDPQADLAWAILGSRTAIGGWLIRQGPVIGSALLAAAREASPPAEAASPR
jgi:beta-lactamase class C